MGFERLEDRRLLAFGNGGVVVTPMNDGVDPTQREIRDAVLQPDGKIVVAGNVGPARYNADGTLDATFNASGQLPGTVVLPGAGWFTSVALQADGKIVIAGFADVGGALFGDMVVMRFNANGALDTTFGQNGRVTTSFSSSPGDAAWKVDVQPWDQKIVVVGAGGPGWAVARYLPDGSLDASFDGDGKLTVPFSEFGINEARSVAFQSDRKIVVAGTAYFRGGDFAVVRLNENGSLDTTFGDGGRAFADFGSVVGRLITNDTAYSMLIQPDGKIVVGGEAGGGYDYLAMARFDSNGTLDANFADNGRLLFRDADTNARGAFYGLAAQADGKLIGVVGRHYAHVAVFRFTSSGTLDTTFNPGGTINCYRIDGSQKFMFNPPEDSVAYDVLVQPDGKIVVVGDSAGKYALARLTFDGVLDSHINLVVAAEDGAQAKDDFAKCLFPDFPDGGAPNLSFQVSNDNSQLFAAQPAIDSTGRLTFTPAPNGQGKTKVTATLRDSGAASFLPGEGEDSPPADESATFEITVVQQAPWQNDNNSIDANNDGWIAPNDPLLVIDYLNGVGAGPITDNSSAGPYFDTSGDNSVSAIDALLVINFINMDDGPPLMSEGEASAPIAAMRQHAAIDSALLELLAYDLSDFLPRRRRV